MANGQTGSESSAPWGLVAVLVVVIAGLVTAGGLVLINRSDDPQPVADEESYVIADRPVFEPVFEPRDARGNDPFYPLEAQLAVFTEELSPPATVEDPVAPTPGPTPGPTPQGTAAFDVAQLDANVKTGLYGGTAENTCDPERLISFLFANPDLGEAWAKVQGIRFVDIPTYIRGLEARVLAEPINVLNHGYNPETGAAYQIDAVLDAGTAVLVDKNGDIRTRCYCGNPILPKPPIDYQPPRCIVFGAYVFVQPGGTERRPNAPRDVWLTGRQTTISGGLWVEVTWGGSAQDTGWVRNNNLRLHYCPVPTTDRFCPGPGVTPVWRTPATNTKVGSVTGTVRTDSGNVDLFAPISPVGGIGNEVIVNDAMLIRFRQASPSAQNSAWVRLVDLNQNSTECFRIRQCVDTNGPVWDRTGGAILPGAGGVQWVEFTGHFAADPVTHAEVRLANGTGAYGWIGQTYIPLPDQSCDRPVRDCAEGDWTVFETATQVLPDHSAHVNSAQVSVIGGPQNGRLQVELAPGGPTGWVDQVAFYDGYNDCRPRLFCATTTAAAFSEYPNVGASVPPITTPTYIEDRGVIVDGVPPHLRIGVGGLGYWVELTQVQGLDPARCETTTISQCPSVPGAPAATFAGALRDPRTLDPTTTFAISGSTGASSTSCCVSGLFNSPNISDVHGGPYPATVVVVGELVVGGTTWYQISTGQYFRANEVLPAAQCVPVCPTPGAVPTWGALPAGTPASGPVAGISQPPAPASAGDCCVTALYTGPSVATSSVAGGFPRLVGVSGGPVGSTPAWFQTAGGDWFPESAVIDPAACQPVPCPAGSTVVPGLRVALNNVVPAQTSTCCVEGDVFDSPAGNMVDTLPAPTTAVVVEVTTLDWYRIVANNSLVWVFVNQFLPAADCAPGSTTGTSTPVPLDCPLPGSLMGRDAQGRPECCVGSSAPPVVGTYTGQTRVASDGVTEYYVLGSLTPAPNAGAAGPGAGWVRMVSLWQGYAFLPANGCGATSSTGTATPGPIDCPVPGSEISRDSQNRPVCCAFSDWNDLMAGWQFDVWPTTLTGETRTTAAGATEYRVEHDPSSGYTTEWMEHEQKDVYRSGFINASHCAPDFERCPLLAARTEYQRSGPEPVTTCCAEGLYGNLTLELVVTGEHRELADGTREYVAPFLHSGYQYLDDPYSGDEWIHESRFVDKSNCAPRPCPAGRAGSIDKSSGPDFYDWSVECCVRVSADRYQVVDLNPDGAGRDQGNGTWEFYAPAFYPSLRDWFPETDFIDIGNVRADPTTGTTLCGPSVTRSPAPAATPQPAPTPRPTATPRPTPIPQPTSCPDRDGDGWCDSGDNCPGVANPDQSDADGDQVGDACDQCTDADLDLICDDFDNCPGVWNPDQTDSDRDGFGDECDFTCDDFDQDGWCDFEDNCPEGFNPDQFDFDGNGIGDACEEDVPGTVVDCSPFGYPTDGNGDGIDDSCFPCVPDGFPADSNGDGKDDICVPFTDDEDFDDDF